MKSPPALSGALLEIAVSFAVQSTTEPHLFPQAITPPLATGLGKPRRIERGSVG